MAVLVNGAQTSHFSIKRVVHQDCVLVPYLFLFVGEVLNKLVKAEVAKGRIKGVNLPSSCKQQVIS